MSRNWWTVAVILLMPAVSVAQTASDSASYRRAQSLVNDGSSVAGRAIVDSLVARAKPGTSEYAEGLYWRAVLSATASDAEMDYRRIVVDYPLSRRAADVLLRLAQLELARADYDGALQHLNRLTLENPDGVNRARAAYWTARVLFEKNDTPRACAANADALARTSEQDTELRNQIAYLNQRCAGVVIASAAVDTIRKEPAKVLAPSPAPVTQATTTTTSTVKPAMPVPTTPRDAHPTMIEPPAKKESPPAASSETTSGNEQYSVQIAAYNVKSQAEAMVVKLRKNGYEARVSGMSAPFRVRIGHYATQAQATAVMRSLKAKQMSGFVVKAESR